MTRAIRALAARPGFTAVAVATLAIGFGVNAAIFSLTRTVLLRPLPYRDVDRLVLVGEANRSRGVPYAPTVPANYVAWRAQVSAFETTAAWRFVYFTLSGTATPLRVQGLRVEPAFFSLLGVTPALGRSFTAGEGRAGLDDRVVLSHGLWRRQFGGDPNIIGRPLAVDGAPCIVVGVLPESFKFFRVLNRELDVWRPFVLDPTDREHSVTLYAKLKPGVTLEAARAEAATAAGRLALSLALLAARTCGVPVAVSLTDGQPEARPETETTVESEAGLIARLEPGGFERLRALVPIARETRAAAHAAGVGVLDAPALAAGRLELRGCLREQTISRIVHRYGSVMQPAPEGRP